MDTFKQNRVIPGTFTGQNMHGEDGRIYPIPPNYASKSKLLVGDKLKLIIDEDSSFIFKQIEPVPRKRVMGVVAENGTIEADGKSYKIISQSLTHFKAEIGDEAVILVPTEMESEWAALENIIKNYD